MTKRSRRGNEGTSDGMQRLTRVQRRAAKARYGSPLTEEHILRYAAEVENGWPPRDPPPSSGRIHWQQAHELSIGQTVVSILGYHLPGQANVTRVDLRPDQNGRITVHVELSSRSGNAIALPFNHPVTVTRQSPE